MATLTREDGTETRDADEIARELAPLSIRLERWELPAELGGLLAKPALEADEKEEVLAALDHRFRELAQSAGYKARDLIVLHPGTPGLDGILAKFTSCHRHDDDEVRYMVDGAGVFGFVRPDGSQVALEVEAGEYINVPAGTEHWFHLTAARRAKAVRYFIDPAGWVPRYSGTAIRAGELGSIDVEYRFPASVDAAKQAQVIAVGQTAGTWDQRHAHRAAQLRGHLARVRAVEAGLATVRFPRANVEGDIASLLTMIFGKYSMAGPAKVTGVRLPDGYGTAPRVGLAGIRERLGVKGRPLVMAIFKPSLGLSAADHAALLEELIAGGLDIVKDDEIMPDLEGAPTAERLAACRAVIERAGRPMLYAVNLTGRADRLLERARELVAQGANALLVNVLAYGFPVLEALARDPAVGVPLFVHPALAGALCGAPDHGLSYPVVLGTLCAHAGADAVLYPAAYGSLPFDPADERAIAHALRARGVAPVPSAGITPAAVPRVLADYGDDVILNSGTAIMDHPQGPRAGVRAFFDALDEAKS